MADFLSSIFGSKPQIAQYQPVDMSQEQLMALQGDIAAWPDIQELGNLYQSYMLNAYETAIPGFKNILALGGQTTQDMLTQADQELKGQVPLDVQQQVQRFSAQQGLTSGTLGSSMSGANAARNLGLTSLDLVGQGAQLAGQAGNAAQRWAALSGAQLPEGMLVTPQQQAQLDMQQNLIKRNIQQQQYNVNAAPDPALQALNQWVEQVGGSVVSSYLGGGMGGGKGGSSYATSYNPTSFGAGAVDTTGQEPYGLSTAPGQGQAFVPASAYLGGGSQTGTTINFGGETTPTSNIAYDFGAGYPAANPNAYVPQNYADTLMYNSNFASG